MATYLGKSLSFGLPRVPFVNCRQFMYLVISLLVLRAGCGIWLYQFLIIAYLFTLVKKTKCRTKSLVSIDKKYFYEGYSNRGDIHKLAVEKCKENCSHAEPVTLMPNRTFFPRPSFNCVILHQIVTEIKCKAYLYPIKWKTKLLVAIKYYTDKGICIGHHKKVTMKLTRKNNTKHTWNG